MNCDAIHSLWFRAEFSSAAVSGRKQDANRISSSAEFANPGMATERETMRPRHQTGSGRSNLRRIGRTPGRRNRQKCSDQQNRWPPASRPAQGTRSRQTGLLLCGGFLPMLGNCRPIWISAVGKRVSLPTTLGRSTPPNWERRPGSGVFSRRGWCPGPAGACGGAARVRRGGRMLPRTTSSVAIPRTSR